MNDNKPLKELYFEYRNYCNEVGNKICSLKTFLHRLKDKGFDSRKVKIGMIIYIEQRNNDPF